MILPEPLIPVFLKATKAGEEFISEAAAHRRVREGTLRPAPYGPPRGLRNDVGITVARTAAGWPAYTLRPRNPGARGHLIYAHGGGWVNEISPQHWQLAAQIAAEARTTVHVLIYPLVPFGTAGRVVDGFTTEVLKCLESAEPTVLAGDSAGGQIVLSTLLHLRDRHQVTLPRTIAIAPAVDLSMKNPEIAAVQPSDPWLGTRGTQVFIDLWRDTLDVDDPTVSPLNGDLEGLGPVTLFSGTRDILNPDGRLFAQRAARAGVDVEYVEKQGQLHVYPLLPTATGRAARQHIVARVREATA
ncbi:MAG: alpha/beta hydrolase fold domain-containing protein [Arthrobacter sp.]|uniref:alpha/beta hydrolase fold domain-containing protein n=1 Tax=unclassified Arthrobacter TaxID=235627 RepID=UPI00264C7416|nr:alpha/beta hydrolase [Micrococcaceae bacterium]MDN5812815.1 alpha/beta hydrolase [Micrococcaceae bacterium]MDN5824670.1 alpha/beta hydrolase [Micrococcaceae bacterium]MDN5878864.1 alpha/beta hydrolase [Micrococcaceae bacterium]MDN5886316.1 alpha/beta hydrolase [Micrococcaceae bacterium]